MATTTNETERTNVTGLDQASNRKEAEYDLVTALLEAASYKEAEDAVTEVEIKRSGKYLFSVHIHPISDADTRFARKKATTYIPNPNNKKLPPIEKETNSALFNSWLIYLATTPEDQQEVWGNPAIMQKYGLGQPVESIDILLQLGEKHRLSDLVVDISDMDEDDEKMDEETFQSSSD